MIDEKRLVKEIKNWIKTDRFEDYSAGYILSDVIEEINKMPKVGEWIPVSERLPEHSELCLVSTGNIVMTCPYCEIKFKEYGVTAWQPLPEPYREESVENENDGNPMRVL